ncbi:MAG: T9SS type A sorting domain-containing protein, partial [Bacteroidetes bacterium]|nr:T9SS type A sorting domain-containing protein [Bacteroidota bacterium]
FRPEGWPGTTCGYTSNVATFGAIGGGSINPNGNWTLIVMDRVSNADIGTLVSWSITFPPCCGPGVGPYTYLWNDPGFQTDSTATGLPAGTYTVIVTDTNGCADTTYVTLSEPLLLTSSITDSTNITCNGVCDGFAEVIPNGQDAPFTYLWSDGQTTDTATSLCSGTYTVTVTDSNGCTYTSGITFFERYKLTDMLICNGIDVGTATISVSGGTSPYNFTWSPFGGTDSIATGLIAGIYIVTVIDNNGCVLLDTVIVDNITGINQATTTGYNIRLYPNPATGKFILQFGKYPKNLVITIYNLIGKVITKIENENPAYKKIEIDLSSEVNGLYFIKIQTDTKIITRKIIVDR